MDWFSLVHKRQTYGNAQTKHWSGSLHAGPVLLPLYRRPFTQLKAVRDLLMVKTTEFCMEWPSYNRSLSAFSYKYRVRGSFDDICYLFSVNGWKCPMSVYCNVN